MMAKNISPLKRGGKIIGNSALIAERRLSMNKPKDKGRRGNTRPTSSSIILMVEMSARECRGRGHCLVYPVIIALT